MLFYNTRYYDPVIGRFISADTIVPSAPALTVAPNDAVAQGLWGKQGGGAANPQELNRYSYVNNNPVKYTDPTGHCPMCIGALIGGSIDFAVQMVSSGGDVSQVNWAQVGVSAAVGATGVGLGGVLANATKSVVANVALNAAASGTVSFIGAEVQNRVQEAVTPGRFAQVDPLRATVTGTLTGGTGAAIGEVIQGGAKALANSRYNSMTLAEKLIENSGSSGIAVITVNLRLFLLWSPGRLSIRTQRPNQHVCFPTAIPKDPEFECLYT